MEKRNFTPQELLQPFNMLRLYAGGAFPMADDTGIINWYMPETRAVIPLDNYNVPRSLRRFLEKSGFEYRFDTAFEEVVRGCAGREETWISEELIEAYKRLYKLGYIHTVEVWENGTLAGGLYGVTYRGAFFGESMFSRVEQASKAALVRLIERLNERDFYLLDVQYMTPHLAMFGAVEIDFDEYSTMLDEAYVRGCLF